MTEILLSNNAFSTLASQMAIDATSLSIESGHGVRFPNPGAGQRFKVTLQDPQDASVYEICHVTARSGDDFTTLIRQQEDTDARVWPAGTLVELRWTTETALAYGVPPGGSTGDILTKTSDGDYDTEWDTPTFPPATATYLTEDDETGTLPNSRQLLPGTNITFDDTTPGERTLNASGGGGSSFDPTDLSGTAKFLDLLTGQVGGVNSGWTVEVFGDFTDGGTFSTNATAGAGNSTGLLGRVARREATFFTDAAGSGDGSTGVLSAQTAAAGLFRRPSGSPASPGGLFGFWRGGFSFPSATASSYRLLVGYVPSVIVPIGTTDGTFDALVNVMALGKYDTDTNLQFIVNDGSGSISKFDTGVAFASVAGQLLELYIYSDFGSDSVRFELRIVDTDTVVSHEFTTNLPAVDTAMYFESAWNEGYHLSAHNVQINIANQKHLYHMSL